MPVNEFREFIFENYYERIGFSKETVIIQWSAWGKKKDLLLLVNKLMGKIPNPCNAKEHNLSFIIKKNTKSVKQSKVITYQPKTFEDASIVDIKSVITEHPKTLRKLSKTGKVSSNSSLYSDVERYKNDKTSTCL